VVSGQAAPDDLDTGPAIPDQEPLSGAGQRTNSVSTNVLGWAATLAMFAVAIVLAFTWGKS
jgi:hypothetical protein